MASAAAYRDLLFQRNGVVSQTFIAWHGGEPSLLPCSYVSDVLALQVEVFGRNALDAGHFANAVQTNLFRLNATLDLMVSRGFLLSVSLDYRSGARVDRAGRDAETAVLDNLERLLREGVICGVALVLGRHNHEHLSEIHDHLERIGAAWLKIIPMLDPPTRAPSGGLRLTAEETVEALSQLFEHRRRRGSRLPVSPLDRVRRTVRGFRSGACIAQQRDRARFGETRFVVHPDGSIASQAGSTKPQRVLGNVFRDGIETIIDGVAYRASLEDDARKRAIHCRHCRYEQACDHRAVLDGPASLETGPCAVESRLCDYVDISLGSGSV